MALEPKKRKPRAKKPKPELPLHGGLVKAPDHKRRRLTGKRFVFTSAQNNTELHDGFWATLLNYCKVTDAQLFVSRFSYNKAGWAKHGGTTVEAIKDDDAIWYDPRIEPFVLDEQVKVADSLLFCGELDILPTAARPLTGLASYTGPNSGIVPHAKVAMESHATMKHQDAKFLYTTGACTLRNYIERKAGQVATFHHVFGALLVEIDVDGQWFARQLLADDTGAFYDLNRYYFRDISGIDIDNDFIVTLGDVHIEKMDHTCLAGAMDMLSALKPKHVFLHDLIDFEARNHHNIKDPHFLARQYARGLDTVQANMESGVRFLAGLNSALPDTQVHVIRSNHDQAFGRWLKEPSAQYDAPNAIYWHLWNWQLHAAAQTGSNIDIFASAMESEAQKNNLKLKSIHWVQEDESVVLYDIEHGMHGHRGINGARGTPAAFRQLGRKANTGHTHSAGIIDGVWTAGVLANLDMEYNAGPSSWSHSHIITYPNGKRCMITQRGTKWKA